ncbi:MspA family porin [Nocardia sp. NPDC020380]|uniref:MspA family porin n=1 Tax=Nocardia sp. NPDC020380 TaxID=3364309 RepID=UPI0037957199
MGKQQRMVTRTLAIAVAGTVGVVFGGGTSSAAVDASNSLVDQQGRTVEAIVADTKINFVPPLDGNPLTREWFHNGKACFHVSGGTGDWNGHITIGYQVGYPATLTGKLNVQYETPQLEVQVTTPPSLYVFNLIPTVGGELDVAFGPGITSVDAANGDVSGTDGCITLAGFHGTVTGVLGTTTVRPYVKLVSSTGDTVMAYGPTTSN